jgi:hypothetical protein
MPTKRHIAFGVALSGLLVVACGGQPDPGTIPTEDTGGIQVVLVTDDFAAGQLRVPVVLYDGTERVADVQRVKLTAFDLAEDPPTPGWTGEATNYSDYEVPYWVAYPDLPHAGFWGLGAEITLSDGSVTQAEFVLEAQERSSSPAVGSVPPASENRTLETVPDIAMLTSGDDPIPALYQMTVAEAMASGKPTVVSFATPAYCTSKLCAPVIHSVEAVYAELGDEVNFIHLEIFKDFETLDYADEVEEWKLTSEPWTFVLDGEGAIVAKLGGPVSPRELTEALAPLLP